MRRPSALTRRLAAGIAALLAVGLATAPAAQAAPEPGTGVPVTVMTRNLYLGGDIQRPLRAVLSLPPGTPAQVQLLAFAHANHELRGIVDQTDFPARSKLLAREIAVNEPALVGLQEVAIWRHGPLELDDIGHADAEVVDYDFLQTLLGDLAALGTPYEAVSVQQESDVEGPAFAGLPGSAEFAATAQDVRLTMRDVIIRPVGGKVKVRDHGSAQYDTRITFPLGGASFAFIRGYNWADVTVGAKSFRFVNTHLESQYSNVALAQAMELLGGPAGPQDQPVIVVCDCNSDPLNHTIKPPPDSVPHSAPYDFITGPGGFTDEWLQFAPAEEGFTSGLSELVDDPDTSKIDHRIDMVFARAAGGGPMPADQGRITGLDPAARTTSGLWASDHAGVVLRLRP